MESTRPIRALMRGLDALTVLNLRNGATVSEVAGEIRLPRTTTYRILETLCQVGYVFRDPSDDRYRLTIMVRGLSDGFDDEAWVTLIARPHLYELGREILWPVAIATLSGASMLVRETADHRSPLAVERYSAGFRVPLLTTAAGRAYLAHCPARQRESLLDILCRSAREEDRPARDRAEAARMIEEVRAQGYGTATRARRVSDETSIAVPIQLEDRVLACVAVRFSSTEVPMQLALERFLPRLRDASGRIRSRFLEQRQAENGNGQSEARPAAPD